MKENNEKNWVVYMHTNIINENNPNAKRIMCIETSEIFNCIKYAKEKYNIKSDGSLTVALKNQNRTAAGLHWKYL